MSATWVGICLLFSMPVLMCIGLVALYIHARQAFLETVLRIFREKPLFIIQRIPSNPNAEIVWLPVGKGMKIRGVYFRTEAPRKGVILFGLEYGANVWNAQTYCDSLLRAGYDVFTFEPRNQGESSKIEGYEPTPWMTRHEVEDARVALAYLESRPDADPKGIGFYGISRGANAGLAASINDRSVRCIVVDGAFDTMQVMIPYMHKWVTLYNSWSGIQQLTPSWIYRGIAKAALRHEEKRLKVRYIHLARRMHQLRRPLMMIHGEKDNYIRPTMAKALFQEAVGAKELWIVPKAKHNQSMNAAGTEYSQRLVAFFDHHLCGLEPGFIATEERVVTRPAVSLT
jgi:uncharacterized protein